MTGRRCTLHHRSSPLNGRASSLAQDLLNEGADPRLRTREMTATPRPLASGNPAGCGDRAGAPRENAVGPSGASEDEALQARNPAHAYMDVLRTLLATLVAFAHGWGLLIADYRNDFGVVAGGLFYVAGFAHPAVIMFFVLSGYWIGRSVVGRSAAGWVWQGYLIDRLSRLLLVLVPALLLGGLLDWVALIGLASPTHLGLTDTYLLNKDVAADLSAPVLLGNLIFLQGILTPTFGTNGPLWSLACEFWYYIWFPALWLTLRRRRPSLALLALALAPLSMTLSLGFAAWLFGAALVGLESSRRVRALADRLGRRRFLIGAGLLLLLSLAWGRTGDYAAEDLVLAACFAVFLLSLLISHVPFMSALRPFAAFGAGSSFSLYAIHFPILAFAAALTLERARLQPSLGAIALVMIATLSTIAIAWIFSRCTEAQTGRARGALRRLLR